LAVHPKKTRPKWVFLVATEKPEGTGNTLQGTNISSQPWKRKLIFPTTLGWDMFVSGRDSRSFPNLIWELMELVAGFSGPGNRRIPREGRR